MAIVVSAPIRTGKTLYCMSIIDKVSKKDPYRMIYTNIVGCTYPGVILIHSTTDKPFDWRDLPNGSLLIYDEAHEHPAFSKDDLLKTFEIDDSIYLKRVAEINSNTELRVRDKDALIAEEKEKQKRRLVRAKEDILDIGRSLTLHGHFGIDIYFITQKPYKLNDSVKASVNEHLILRRLFKLKACTIYSFSELQEQFGLSTMRNALSWKFWLYPKQLYKFYISAEEHEKSTKIPFSLMFWILLPVLIIGAALYKSMGTRIGQKFFGSEQTVAESSPAADPNDKTQPTMADQYAQQKKINDCMVQFSYTLQQCEEMLNPEIRDKRYADLQASTHANTETIAMNYNVNDPYGSQITEFQIQAKDYPRLSGCVQYGNKIVGFDQQGNRMPDLDPNACKRWLAGERLFDYTRDRNTASMQTSQPAVSAVEKSMSVDEIAQMQEAKRQGLI